MQPLSALDSITLEAFQAALHTFRRQGLELPDAIAHVAARPYEHIQELDLLSECDRTFESLYQAERLNIQNKADQQTRRVEAHNPQPIDLTELVPPVTANSETIEDDIHAQSVSPTQSTVTPPFSPSTSGSKTSDITIVGFKEAEPSTSSTHHKHSFWDNLDRIGIMGAGGGFLGGMIVQLFGGGATQLIGAAVGMIVGGAYGWWSTVKQQRATAAKSTKAVAGEADY